MNVDTVVAIQIEFNNCTDFIYRIREYYKKRIIIK